MAEVERIAAVHAEESVITALQRTNFFFQAEDGIRDGHVTGVQTCALPIYRRRRLDLLDRAGGDVHREQRVDVRLVERAGRSEERRVGKECRSRWSPYH